MKRKVPSLIYTLIMTTITAISWVFFSIYRAINKPLPAVIPPEITDPLSPDINTDILGEKLKERKYFEEGSFKETTVRQPTPPAETKQEVEQVENKKSKEGAIDILPEQ